MNTFPSLVKKYFLGPEIPSDISIFYTFIILLLTLSIHSHLSADDTNQIVALQNAIKFNYGGHVNHSIFWKNMCPKAESGVPEGELAEAINRSVTSYTFTSFLRQVIGYEVLAKTLKFHVFL